MITFEYVPYREHANLDSDEKINKILRIVKGDKIVLMEGRLKSEEEAQLIERTMEQITRSFKGVSFCTVYPNKKTKEEFSEKVKNAFYKILMGNRDGITIVGPASIIKEIRRNPNKIELLTKSSRRRSKNSI